MEQVLGKRDSNEFRFIGVGFDFKPGHPGNMDLELRVNV